VIKYTYTNFVGLVAFMNFIEKLIVFLQGTMEEPHSYGWFHILFILLIVALTVFLCIKYKDSSDKVVNVICLIAWIIMVVFELYKQLIYTFNYQDGVSSWDYQWYAFPFQLCSTPMYVLPFIVFLKGGKIRDSVMAYMMTFSLFGGLATFIYPEQVFITMTGINIQSMLHHGLQIAVGIFLFVHNRKRVDIKFILRGFIVFAIMMAIALLLNIVVYNIFKARGVDETFNMFYIGPYFDCTLPLLSIFYPMMNKVLFIILYFICFCLIAVILYYIQLGIYKLILRLKKVHG